MYLIVYSYLYIVPQPLHDRTSYLSSTMYIVHTSINSTFFSRIRCTYLHHPYQQAPADSTPEFCIESDIHAQRTYPCALFVHRIALCTWYIVLCTIYLYKYLVYVRVRGNATFFVLVRCTRYYVQVQCTMFTYIVQCTL